MTVLVRAPEIDYPLTFWRLLWTVSPLPVHLADADQCEEHDDCAVCLDKLCTSTTAVSLVAIARRRCRPALSACRLRPEASSAGFSAARTGGVEFCKDTLSGLWGRMATLPCGHKFHTGCMDSVALMRLQCPTCRRTLGDDWVNVQPEQKLVYRLGLGAIFGFYCVVCLWHMWTARGYALLANLASAPNQPAQWVNSE